MNEYLSICCTAGCCDNYFSSVFIGLGGCMASRLPVKIPMIILINAVNINFASASVSAMMMLTPAMTMELDTLMLTWIFQGSSYLSGYGYEIMHRMHHAYNFTAKDPHSPSHDDNLFAMMWKTMGLFSSGFPVLKGTYRTKTNRA